MVFDRNVLALDVSGFAQALTKRRDEARIGREATEKSDYRLFWLLRARVNRPRVRRSDAAQKRDELAPSHVLPPASETASYRL
jgi:hypothetical protein